QTEAPSARCRCSDRRHAAQLPRGGWNRSPPVSRVHGEACRPSNTDWKARLRRGGRLPRRPARKGSCRRRSTARVRTRGWPAEKRGRCARGDRIEANSMSAAKARAAAYTLLAEAFAALASAEALVAEDAPPRDELLTLATSGLEVRAVKRLIDTGHL